MARGGFRPGAGRPKGSTKTAKVQPLVGEAQKRNVGRQKKDGASVSDAHIGRFSTAMDFAMAVINDPEVDMSHKIRLAAAVLPFQHAKLAEKPASKKGEEGDAAKMAADGRFGAPAAPKLVVSNK